MTAWIERYRRQAEERFERLDALLDEMATDEDEPPQSSRGRAS